MEQWFGDGMVDVVVAVDTGVETERYTTRLSV
jgi:hypothetical protein